MIARFLDEAIEEFGEAVHYYNAERPGLGYEFAVEVRKALRRIKKYPESWLETSPGIRKCIVNRFPFALLYHEKADMVLILAVMHLRRKPGYWKKRIDRIIKE